MKRSWVGLLALAWLALGATPGAQAASPAKCHPDDRTETGLQGQLPMPDRATGRAADGYTCNLTEVGFFASTSFANFDTYDNCAYYSDTIGLYSAEGGTIVLDVSDPRKPVQTAYLTARATKNAGESLRINHKRGLLAADRYVIPDLGPGQSKFDEPEVARSLAVYDLKKDCRKPELLADAIMPTAVGHEGCWQPDGRVYYMASTATITPIDVSDPKNPKQLSEPQPWGVHGCSTSDDGTRGYFGDIGAGRLLIADTTEVQARKPGAAMKQISEVPTPQNAGQQATIPVSYGGKPYLINWSEFVDLGHQCTPGDGMESNYGYAIIVDLADEKNPKVVSKLQTEVQKPENCQAVLGDSIFLTTQGLTAGDVFPLVGSRVFLYDTHYCVTDRLHDPTILACAAFGSGIRVYDIRDPRAPSEIAYYNPGSVKTPDGSAFVANATVSRPVIRSDLAQIWFPDISKGFHVVQFREGVWPFAGHDACPHEDYWLRQYDVGYDECRKGRRERVQLPSGKPCRSRRDFTIHLQRAALRSATVYVNGRRVRVLRGSRLRARVNLRGLPRGTYTVRVVVVTKAGREITTRRRYRTCVPSARSAAASGAVRAGGPGPDLQRIAAICRVVGEHVVRAAS